MNASKEQPKPSSHKSTWAVLRRSSLNKEQGRSLAGWTKLPLGRFFFALGLCLVFSKIFCVDLRQA